MKKLINDPGDFIRESLAGLIRAHAGLVMMNADPLFVYRADAPVRGKVAIVSGGGSGHEPLHTGYVGPGMLDAACPGEVFTSPTPDQMLAAAKQVDGGSGVLFIVKNYSGDIMNFEMAAEMASAEGIAVASVIIDDDVAVNDSLYTQGRRGVGTTVLAEKICGAAADQGSSLSELVALCRRVSSAGRSMGVALSSCTVPAAGEPTFTLEEGEMEFGIGIHGEPGRERIKLKKADQITELMAEAIIKDPQYVRTLQEWDREATAPVERQVSDPPFAKGDPVLLFVNGMGGTPLSELYLVFRKAAAEAEKHGLRILRSLVGNYITSLEMQGFSLTLLRMDDQMLSLWDAPVLTPALRWGR
ncbi:MAG: dihydroxyacetone kinase subunit DhaK [Spirochaetaceae bacterium]|nr:MAG: dihydroxyacetone kinase subunit DhaK [Spirochaetaceae bacterium]